MLCKASSRRQDTVKIGRLNSLFIKVLEELRERLPQIFPLNFLKEFSIENGLGRLELEPAGNEEGLLEGLHIDGINLHPDPGILGIHFREDHDLVHSPSEGALLEEVREGGGGKSLFDELLVGEQFRRSNLLLLQFLEVGHEDVLFHERLLGLLTVGD